MNSDPTENSIHQLYITPNKITFYVEYCKTLLNQGHYNTQQSIHSFTESF